MPYNELPEPYESLYRIQRALAGHVSCLAACEMNESFTEYNLYETVLRVLLLRGFTVTTEFGCKELKRRDDEERNPKDDKRRIDFVARKSGVSEFALEIKWPRNNSNKQPALDIAEDISKLELFRDDAKRRRAKAKEFLCVFGRFNHFTGFGNSKALKADFKVPTVLMNEYNKRKDGGRKKTGIFAMLCRTQFGCKIYELSDSSSSRRQRKVPGDFS